MRRSENARTKAIAAIFDIAKTQIQVAQSINQGQFVDADRELAVAQKKLEEQASVTKDAKEKSRLTQAASSVATQRSTVGRAAAAPKAVQRDEALKMNHAAMDAMGF